MISRRKRETDKHWEVRVLTEIRALAEYADVETGSDTYYTLRDIADIATSALNKED